MKKRSASHDLATFPSPGAPPYRGTGAAALHKGWASERVPAGGRHIVAPAAAAAFGSGRAAAALPSKWEDAERWICSPLGGNVSKSCVSSQPSRPHKVRPKSKSGPIVHTAAAAAAPAPAAVGSPFSTGVLAPESVYGGGGLAGGIDWPEMKESHCCPSPKISLSSDSNGETPMADSGAVSQRDMATQMSPRDCRCSCSSAAGRPSFASSPPGLLSITEQQSDHSARLEVRDVEVDKRATMIKWSKRGGIKISRKSQHYVDEFGEKSFEISEAGMDSLKWQREEAKITAWENLQKAKAEAAIRKLEMKLEKKRSATIDKIVDKLRTAELKAHKMRSKLSDDHDDRRQQVPRSPRKLFSFRKHVRVGSLSRLFACRAF